MGPLPLYLCKDMNQKLKDFVHRNTGLLILFFMLLGTGLQASSPDSLRTRWINGKKFTLHKVAAKETWSSVSRRYNLSIEELQKANPGVSGLKIGQIINIPAVSGTTPAEAAPKPSPSSSTTSTPKPPSSTTSKTHTVQKGETLYRISKMYGMSVDDLRALNSLPSNNVSIGQKLKVQSSLSTPVVVAEPVSRTEVAPLSAPKEVKETAPATEEPVKESPKEIVRVPIKDAPKEVEAPKEAPKVVVPPATVDTPHTSSAKDHTGDELPKAYTSPGASRTSVIEKDPKSGMTIEKITEVGVATWLTETDLNQNKFYALHRTAPVGTIIKVTNRMNNNSVFVKVVGVLPDTGDNENIIVKITQASAQRIGAIDQKFTAELTYAISK